MYLFVTFYVIFIVRFRILMENSIADQVILIKDIQIKIINSICKNK